MRTLVVLALGLLAIPFAAAATPGAPPAHALSPQRAAISLSTSALTVLYGHRVTIAGQVADGREGRNVSITASPFGRPSFTMATLTTGQGGSFRFVANPTILTSYQARLAGDAASPLVTVDVRPTIAVHELGDGRLQAHVASAAFLYGRTVELQRLANGAWKTIARRPLRSTATAMFRDGLVPNSTIRVAMSVNQAGSGYLGSTSHPILYRGI